MNRRSLFRFLASAPFGIATGAAMASDKGTPNQMREGLGLPPLPTSYASGPGSWVQKSRDADCMRRIRFLRKELDAEDTKLKSIQLLFSGMKLGDPRYQECFDLCDPIYRRVTEIEDRIKILEGDDPLGFDDALRDAGRKFAALWEKSA